MSIQALQRDAEEASLSHGRLTVDSSSGISLPPDIKFKTPFAFCKISQGSTFKMKYLSERWHFFNKELFGGSMTEPKLIITKAFKHMKTLGFWRPYTKELSIHHKLFTLDSDKQILGTLVHEMAHEYDSDILQTPIRERMIKKGHGPSWDGIMRSIGLPADAMFAGDSDELIDEEQKENLNIRRGKVESPNKITPASFDGKPYIPVMFIKGSGALEPMLLLDSQLVHGEPNSSYRGFTKKDLRTGSCWYVDIDNCLKPTSAQLKKFPPEFDTIRTLEIVNYTYERYKP